MLTSWVTCYRIHTLLFLAPINETGSDGRTALMYAASYTFSTKVSTRPQRVARVSVQRRLTGLLGLCHRPECPHSVPCTRNPPHTIIYYRYAYVCRSAHSNPFTCRTLLRYCWRPVPTTQSLQQRVHRTLRLVRSGPMSDLQRPVESYVGQ
jgi:hypothetical protein